MKICQLSTNPAQTITKALDTMRIKMILERFAVTGSVFIFHFARGRGRMVETTSIRLDFGPSVIARIPVAGRRRAQI